MGLVCSAPGLCPDFLLELKDSVVVCWPALMAFVIVSAYPFPIVLFQAFPFPVSSIVSPAPAVEVVLVLSLTFSASLFPFVPLSAFVLQFASFFLFPLSPALFLFVFLVLIVSASLFLLFLFVFPKPAASFFFPLVSFPVQVVSLFLFPI